MMDALALQVVRRFLSADVVEEPEKVTKGGVPPRWQEWLETVHQRGSEKVPNPNSATRSKFPQISFNTALKDKAFFQKALKSYREWAKKNPDKSDKSDKKPTSGDVPPRGMDPKGALKVSDKELDVLIAKHKEEFDKAASSMKSKVKSYMEDEEGNPGFEIFEALSEQEKMVHVAGHLIGEIFEKSLSAEDKKMHETWANQWQSSSSNPTSCQVHGALESLGVKGHQTDKDKYNSDYREAGKKKDALKSYLGKVYAFTQAYYKHIGLKEVSLYRGVVSEELDRANDGDEVQVQTRELSSYTSDPRVAAKFGRPLEMKVPVKNILWSNITRPRFTGQEPPGIGESEIAVMGASDIPGKVMGKAAETLVDMGNR